MVCHVSALKYVPLILLCFHDAEGRQADKCKSPQQTTGLAVNYHALRLSLNRTILSVGIYQNCWSVWLIKVKSLTMNYALIFLDLITCLIWFIMRDVMYLGLNTGRTYPNAIILAGNVHLIMTPLLSGFQSSAL